MCNGTEEEEIIFDDFEELKAVVPEGILLFFKKKMFYKNFLILEKI